MDPVVERSEDILASDFEVNC